MGGWLLVVLGMRRFCELVLIFLLLEFVGWGLIFLYRSVDYSAALAMEGVRCYVSAEDVPGFDPNVPDGPNLVGPVMKGLFICLFPFLT